MYLLVVVRGALEVGQVETLLLLHHRALWVNNGATNIIQHILHGTMFILCIILFNYNGALQYI